MARKTVTTETVDDDDAEPSPLIPGYSFEDTDDTATRAENALEGLLDEFSGSGDAIVNVYRQISGANNIAFLFKTTPTEMRGGEIMEKLRDEYGSGDYRVHIRADNRIVGNKGFSVERAEKPEPVAPRDNSSDMMAMVLAQMNNQQTLMVEAIRAFGEAQKAHQPPAPVDPVAMQAGMINALVALKGLATDNGDPQRKDPVEMLIQGITLARELQPRDTETNSNDLLLEGIKHFGPVIAQASHSGMIPGMPRPSGAPQLGPPPAEGQPSPEQKVLFEKQLLKTQLGFLVKNAMEGRNPELYAELLIDQVGEKKVLEFIGQPEAMDKLIALVPEVESVRPWFERLRVCILELTAPENADHNEETEGTFFPGTPMGGVIIPPAPDAVSDTPSDSDTSGAPTGPNGDTPHA